MIRSKKGVAIEWAIIFGLIIFGLIALLLSFRLSVNKSMDFSDARAEMRFELDQIGEYFIRAISGGGDFPTGNEMAQTDFGDDYLWMDEDAANFFLDANKRYYYKIDAVSNGDGGFRTWYTENGTTVKLTVFRRAADGGTDEEALVIVVEEDYQYDISGLFTKRPIFLERLKSAGTVYHIIEWTINDQIELHEASKDGLLTRIFKGIVGGIGNLLDLRGDPGDGEFCSITYILDGGKGSEYVTQPKGETVKLQTPQKPGFKFDGWSKTDGKMVADPNNYVLSRSVKLFAHWSPWTVTFVSEEEGSHLSGETVQYGCIEPASFPTATPGDTALREFDGWFTEDGRRVSPTDTFVPEGNVTLYARYKNRSYATVLFYSDKNDTDPWAHYFDKDTRFFLTGDTNSEIDDVAKGKHTGYHFAYWVDEAGNQYKSNAEFAINHGGVFELWGVWEPNSYTVKFHKNDGSGETSTQTFVYGTAQNLTEPFARPGFVLAGWAKAEDSSTKAYDNKQSVSNLTSADGGTFNLYAIWTAYTITFDPNGGTVLPTAVAYTENMKLPTPKHPGYRFDGWFTAASGGSKVDDSYAPTGNVTLYAHWTAYTITFDAAGGTVSIGSMPYSETMTLPLPTNGRYKFQGWWSGETHYMNGETPKAPESDVTFVAQWSESPYFTLQYDLCGGKAPDGWQSSYSYMAGAPITLNSGVTRAGYDFVGWFTAASGGTEVKTGDLMADNDLTVYAHWTEHKEVTVFDANGGAWGSDKTVFVNLCFSAAASSPSDFPTRGGYIFKGWSTDKSADPAKDYDGRTSSFTVKEANVDPVEKTYYAIWEPVTFELIDRGVVGKMNYAQYLAGGLKGITLTSRDGYHFAYWYPDGKDTGDVTKTDWYPVAGDKLNAKWEPNTYTVKFNGNGGESGSMTELPYTYGQSYKLPANAFARTNYVFDGWATTAGGSAVYGNGAEVSNLTATDGGTVTLYAVWEPLTYTVTFDKNGGTGGSESVKAPYGKAMPAITLPTRKGYTFEGYFDANGTKYYNADGTSAGTWDKAESATLYARWQLEECTVTFNNNGATKTDEPLTTLSFTRSGSDKIPTNHYTSFVFNYYRLQKTGYTFNGWNTKADGSGIHYDDGALGSQIVKDATGTNVTLYAEWIYTVSFEKNNGSGSMSNQTMYYNQSTQLNPNAFTRTGYQFEGWATSRSGAAAYEDQQSVENIQSQTLYAVWKANTYTVEYYKDNGTFWKSVTCTYDASFNLETEKVYGTTKKGYTLYWAIDENNTYKNGDSQKNLTSVQNGTVKLTAVWIENSSCVIAGTLITMADGTRKPVEDIVAGDMVLTWDLVTGTYSAKPVVFNDAEETAEYDVIYVTFSDGTVIGIVSEHGFFDADLGQYVYLDENAGQYIGHAFVKEDGSTVTLTDVEIRREWIACYSPVAFGDLCYYTNGMLSMPGGISGLFNIFDVDTDTLKYNEEQMQKDIETYGLLDMDAFSGLITEDMFEAFNGKYLGVAVGKGLLTWDYIAYLAERYAPLCE